MAQSDAPVTNESGAQREDRIRSLFKQLDVNNKGKLDRTSLKKGFQRINHPLQNADSFLDNVMRAADFNHDGLIEYDEFKRFIIETERELRRLFDRIDTSRNGKLEFEEVQYALEQSGIAIHPKILHAFFDSVDSNHDGVIEFNEWRDFLLLVPLDRASIKNVFVFYQEHSQITSEGDALASYDTMRGLGYFTAGGIAGAVSRTATAPFDRLKTFLIANTGGDRQKSAISASVGKDAMKAVENGQIGKAIKKAGSPLVDAVKYIYRVGGLRSFFVGICFSAHCSH
jgi:solute carrier family 25 (mitochondrial phosphate transporter), member 23/24/25/41